MRPDVLYIHVPFCVARCRYCGFASSVYETDGADDYLGALGMEFDERAARLAPRTVFIGGGTPTALSDAQLDCLLALVDRLDTSRLEEFTVEANPCTLDMNALLRMRAAGVTRVSIGAQTFSDFGLAVLGRTHTSKRIRAAVAMAREAGFDDVSLDLICAWPGQGYGDWVDDLEDALALKPTHLSCYCLTWEEGTDIVAARDRGELLPVAEPVERAMFDHTLERLPEAGLRHYEISNFALPGCECRHNTAYWQGEEYIGLGAGAHSYVDGVRFSNETRPADYISRMVGEGTARSWEETLPPDRRARELAVVWLRMRDGVDGEAFRERTGFDLDELLGGDLAKLVEAGWIERRGAGIRLSREALPVADSILSELVM